MLHTICRRVGPLQIAVALITAAAASGCGNDGLPRGSVHGQVTLAGKPMERGRILFLPHDGPAVTAVIQDGKYVLSLTDGPMLGLNHVEVEAEMDLGFEIDDEQAFARRKGAPLPKNPVPAEFNSQSKLSTVIAEGDNEFNVTIPGRPGR